MKYLILSILFFALNSSAQTANIKDIPVDGDTNISITKGKTATPQKTYEIMSETADVEGEPETLSKDARTSWKKACADWKTETKETNKENQILSINCGKPTCDKSENVTTTCKSVGTYKMKVKVQ
jgi:hypothetical protein